MVALDLYTPNSEMSTSYSEWLLERIQSDEEDDNAIAAIADVLAGTDIAHIPDLPIKRRKHVKRNRAEGHQKLFLDYFTPNATYKEHFRRRY